LCIINKQYCISGSRFYKFGKCNAENVKIDTGYQSLLTSFATLQMLMKTLNYTSSNIFRDSQFLLSLFFVFMCDAWFAVTIANQGVWRSKT